MPQENPERPAFQSAPVPTMAVSEAPKSNKGLVTGLVVLIAVLFVVILGIVIILITRTAPVSNPVAGNQPTPTLTATPVTSITPVAGTNPTDNSIFYNGLYFKDGVAKSVRNSLPKLGELETYGYNGLYAYSVGKTLKVYKFNGTGYALVNEKATDKPEGVEFQQAVNYGANEIVVYLAGLTRLNDTPTTAFDESGTEIFADDVYYAYGIYNLVSNTLTLKVEGQHLQAFAPDEIAGMTTMMIAANPATKTVYTYESIVPWTSDIETLNLDTKKTGTYTLSLPLDFFYSIKPDFSGIYYTSRTNDTTDTVTFYNFATKKETKYLGITEPSMKVAFQKEKADGSYKLFCGAYTKGAENVSRCYFVDPSKKFKFNDISSGIGAVTEFDYVDGYGFILTTAKGDYLWNPEVDSKVFAKIAAL